MTLMLNIILVWSIMKMRLVPKACGKLFIGLKGLPYVEMLWPNIHWEKFIRKKRNLKK